MKRPADALLGCAPPDGPAACHLARWGPRRSDARRPDALPGTPPWRFDGRHASDDRHTHDRGAAERTVLRLDASVAASEIAEANRDGPALLHLRAGVPARPGRRALRAGAGQQQAHSMVTSSPEGPSAQLQVMHARGSEVSAPAGASAQTSSEGSGYTQRAGAIVSPASWTQVAR